jgi:hypothetical protein
MGNKIGNIAVATYNALPVAAVSIKAGTKKQWSHESLMAITIIFSVVSSVADTQVSFIQSAQKAATSTSTIMMLMGCSATSEGVPRFHV